MALLCKYLHDGSCDAAIHTIQPYEVTFTYDFAYISPAVLACVRVACATRQELDSSETGSSVFQRGC